MPAVPCWTLLLTCCLAACAAAPLPWNADVPAVLAGARAAGADVVAFFALPGRELSDRMEQQALRDDAVLAALARGGFHSLWLDGFTYQRLYAQWVGGGEGMGICVLDGEGQVYAARPGPQDPSELVALLDQAAAARGAVAAARKAVVATPGDGAAQYRLGVLLLELGCRIGTEELLVSAAQRGVLDAHHRLARLFALDGMVARSRQWLRTAVPSPARDVTEGYVLFKERRPAEAVLQFEAALRRGIDGPDRLRARLYLGKALHESGHDAEATVLLQALATEAPATTFGAGARHTLNHLQETTHDHSH